MKEEESALSERYRIAAQGVLGELFKEQLALIQDPHPWKSVLCPRRVGKSFALMAYALYTALTVPGSTILIATLTLKNTKKLYWSDLIEQGEKHGLGFDRPGKSHNTDGWLKLDNGSIILMGGAETMGACEHLRGPAYDLILLDECASFNADVFAYLLEDVLLPAIMDTSGTVVIAGTPGDIMAGDFFEATYPQFTARVPGTDERQPITRSYADPDDFWLQGLDVEPQWSRHHWTQEQNVARPNLWSNCLRLKKAKRYADDNPTWIQEYLGQWTPRADTLVYSLAVVVGADLEAGKNPRCYWEPGVGKSFNRWGLSIEHRWQYLLGVDLGYEDPTGFVVVAWSETFGAMRVVYQHKESHMKISQVAEHVLELERDFGGFDVQICDTGSGGKQIVVSMNDDHGTDLEAANKTKKRDFIKLLNSDFWDGKMQMEEDSPLALEMFRLNWDTKGEALAAVADKGKLLEDPKAENHLADCLLYISKYVQAGRDVSDDEYDPDAELSWDERQELQRIEQLRRDYSQKSGTPFGEGFSPSMEPDYGLDQGTLDALRGGIF